MRVAVIGSGIAGLTAARLLSERHQVALFERQASPGMGAHSFLLPGADGRGVRADLPLRVFHRGYYPNLLALYARIGVETVPVDYTSSFTNVDSGGVFRFRTLQLGTLALPLLAGRPLWRRVQLRLAREALHFYVVAPRDLAKGRLNGLTLGQYLVRRGYSNELVRDFLLPAFATICTCSYERVAEFPAPVMVRYLTAGGGLSQAGRAAGGSEAVVGRLLEGVQRVECKAEIAGVLRLANSVELRMASGEVAQFDQVVIATQANHALELLSDATRDEAAALAGFQYHASRVLLHTDAAFMPPVRASWTTVNFFVSGEHDSPMATIWMNRVYPGLARQRDVFQTWNPFSEPGAGTLLAEASFERPVVDEHSQAAIASLDLLHDEPGRRIWFCGSYARDGIPLLESAVTSTLEVARRIGILQ